MALTKRYQNAIVGKGEFFVSEWDGTSNLVDVIPAGDGHIWLTGTGVLRAPEYVLMRYQNGQVFRVPHPAFMAMDPR